MSTYYICSKPKSFSIDALPAPAFLKAFLANELDLGLSQHTVQNYYMILRTFFKWLLCRDNPELEFKDANIQKLTFETVAGVTSKDIRSFLHFCEDERRNSKNALAVKLSAVKTFYHYYCADMKLIPADPARDILSPAYHATKPRKAVKSKPLTEKESIRLLNAACYSDNPSRDYCILIFFLNCGLRLTELVTINCYDIKDNVLSVRGSKARQIYLNDTCRQALEDWLIDRSTIKKLYDGGDQNALFVSRRLGKRMTERSIELILDKTFKQAGIDKNGRSPQNLRATAASLMYHSGAVGIPELHAILGNTTSLPIAGYTRTSKEKVRNSMEDFELQANEEGLRNKKSVLPKEKEPENPIEELIRRRDRQDNTDE